MAAWGAFATVRLTKELRWEADVRRVLEALVAIHGACREISLSSVEPSFVIKPAGLMRAQQQLAQALGFPRLVTDNDSALDLLERLRTMDLGSPTGYARHDGPEWIAGISADATKAETLLTTQPPPPKMPGWYLRLVTAPAQARARRQA